jgi:hypothetical protein
MAVHLSVLSKYAKQLTGHRTAPRGRFDHNGRPSRMTGRDKEQE